MTFAEPWVLLALCLLPLLWWLLRATPPAPRRQVFPALRLLLGLDPGEETPARTPPWLLALRLFAAALVILGLARPLRSQGTMLPGAEPVLLVLDDGWASAADWQARLQAANATLDLAEQRNRKVALLTTSRDGSDAKPVPTPPMPAPELRSRLAALHPQPWPVDRQAAAEALAGWRTPGTAVIYIADGLSHGADMADFAAALSRIGPVTEITDTGAEATLMLAPRSDGNRLVARIARLASPLPAEGAVLARSGDGHSLARGAFAFPPNAGEAEAAITLPVEMRNQITSLTLDGPPSAAGVWLLDEASRRRPVGLLAGNMANADSPLTGALYYLRRALSPTAELRDGDLNALLGRDISMIVLADMPLPPGPDHDALDAWVRKGGLLVRFAGPLTAGQIGGEQLGGDPTGDGDQTDTGPATDQPPTPVDTLLPVRLLPGDRQLGGALSWSKPAGLAPFAADSPFSGLKVPDEVKVTRQVLAAPSAQLATQAWATLTDGTPLITQAPLGAGRVVLFHVTANADWSNLPLSGLFVSMLQRLIQLAIGVAPDNAAEPLIPAQTLDGFGTLGTPPQAAAAIAPGTLASTKAAPAHPPGYYGQSSGRRALNLGSAVPLPEAAAPIPGAQVLSFANTARATAFGPALLALATALLAADLLIGLLLRGLLRPRPRRPTKMGPTKMGPAKMGAAKTLLLLLLFAWPASPSQALETGIPPALMPRLAFVLTGNGTADATAKAGLESLSDFVNRRTAATLAEPDAITPGRDDLSFYPLLYWLITANAATPDSATTQALNDYMSRGGIIVIDTGGGDTGEDGSGAGFAPGATAALKRVVANLSLPPLAPLNKQHVLSHSFYLLQDFPGRFDGADIWVQRDEDRSNDSVSPVIIGANGWAAAWATDAQGRPAYAAVPGGARQRVLAYRFGVNLVMYALTGNYKGDQVHIPFILQRLGQ